MVSRLAVLWLTEITITFIVLHIVCLRPSSDGLDVLKCPPLRMFLSLYKKVFKHLGNV